MRTRAAAILIQNNQIALIERQRPDRHYFSFPGGGVDEGETPEQAVVREVLEELGLHVRILRQVAEFWFRGNRQVHFLVEQTGGEFGTGTGDEFSGKYDQFRGTYHPLWMPVRDLPLQPVQPREIAALVVESLKRGWVKDIVVITQEEN